MTKSTKSARSARSARSAAKARAEMRAAARHGAPKDKASEHYHREKARRERRASPENDVMAAAKREYLALLESDAAKGKGGRPKKKAAEP